MSKLFLYINYTGTHTYIWELIYNYLTIRTPRGTTTLAFSVMILNSLTLFAPVLQNIQNSC